MIKLTLLLTFVLCKQSSFIKTQSGKIPLKVFLDSLSPKHAQKVAWVLELIERLDQIPVQYFKKLKSTDDIWEVRARVGSNSFRLLGFIDDNEFVILTNGFAKKSRKKPKKEIKLTEQRKVDYLSRKGGKT